MLIYFVLIPIGKTFYYSFFAWDAISSMKFIAFRNYTNLIKDPIFRIAALHVLIYVLTSLAVEIPLGLVLAFVISGKIRGQKLFRVLFFQPVVLPATAVALMFLLIYEPNFGLLNSLFKSIGLDGLTSNWLADRKIAFFPAMIPRIWQNIGLSFIILQAGIKSIPYEFFEAAFIDGIAENSFRMFRIILPMLWDKLQVCIILVVVGVMKSFEHIFALTEGGPNHATEIFGTYLFDSIFRSMEYGYGSSLAVVIFVTGLIFTFVFKKFFSGEMIEY